MRIVEHCNRLSTEAMDSYPWYFSEGHLISLEVFKTELYKVLSNLFQLMLLLAVEDRSWSILPELILRKLRKQPKVNTP